VAKPVVDGLERSLEGKADVLRLDVRSQVGSQAAMAFGVRGVPTLIVVDGSGQPALTQAGAINDADVLAEVDELLATGQRRK
jgi:thioredoxin-like negative regulator of GroEL